MSGVSASGSSTEQRDGKTVQNTLDTTAVRLLEEILIELQTLNRLLRETSGTPA